MKKRSVKAFDLKTFETKEELLAEIKRLENLGKIDYKKQSRLNKGLDVVIFTALATGFISSCVAFSAFLHMTHLNTELKDIATTMTYLDGYEETYKEEISALSNKLANGEITKKQFDKELINLESKEHIRSVAPNFCSNDLVNAYDETEELFNNRKTASSLSAGVFGISALSYLGATIINSHISNKYTDYNNRSNLSKLYSKKQELEQQEAEKTV